MKQEVILASASPRRRELMEFLPVSFRVIPAVGEERARAECPWELVEQLSFQKAEEISQKEPGCWVIGADTVVFCDGQILGKPHNGQHAFEMLKCLQGNTHQVYTGVTLLYKGAYRERIQREGAAVRKTFHVKTDVEIYPMDDEEIKGYMATGEPFDKAGAYGIQGCFAAFVKEIRGDYFNVVGLPLSKLYQEMKELKIL